MIRLIPYVQDHVLSPPVPQIRKLWRCIRGTAYLKLEIHNSAIWLGRGKGQVEAGRDVRHDSQSKTSSVMDNSSVGLVPRYAH